MSEAEEMIREKITHVLSIYPKLSPSMLQTGIGTSMPPFLWRPVLLDLISKSIVKMEEEVREAPSGRHRLYTILSLVKINKE